MPIHTQFLCCLRVLFEWTSLRYFIAFARHSLFNRKFRNRTQSSQIELNLWIKFDCSVNNFARLNKEVCYVISKIGKASVILKTLEPWKTCLFQLQFLKETQEFLKAFLREIKSSIQLDSLVILHAFDLVRLLNSIKLISWIEFDLVRLKYSSIGFDSLCWVYKRRQLFNYHLAWKVSDIM